MSLPNDPDLFVDVVCHADCAAQRDLLAGIAAHHGVFHVEPGVRDRRLNAALEQYPCFRETRLQLVVGLHHVGGEFVGHFEYVEFTLLECQQPRIAFIQNRDLDLSDQRKALALEARIGSAICGVVAVGVGNAAKRRTCGQHDPLATPPILQLIRAGADRVGHHPTACIAVRLHHFAGHGRGRGTRQFRRQIKPRIVELHLQRIAIDYLQAFDWRIVVEFARNLGTGQHCIHADNPSVEHIEMRRAHAGVKRALPREGVVGCSQLASLAFKRGIVGEVDARLHAYRPGRAVVGAFRQCGRGVGHDHVRA